MKILQVCSAEVLGGGERHVIDLTRGLVERGHELHLATRPDSALGAALAGIPAYRHELPLRNALDLPSVLALTRILNRHRIDLLHAHVARDYIVCGLAARLSGAGLFITRHHFNPIKSNPFYAWALADARAMIGVSASVQHDLKRAFPKLAARTAVIPNWIDARSVGTVGKEEARDGLGIRRRLAVGLVGQLTPLKRQDLFINAAAKVCRTRDCTDTDFLLVGAPSGKQGEDYERRLRELAMHNGLRKQLTFTGFIQDIAARLAAFDIIVAPSVNEAFSLALVEAMAAGCAVIASRVGGMAEIVEDGVNGLLVPPNDEEALAAALTKLLGNDELRSRLGHAARLSAIARFEREQVIDRIERLYAGGD